jgi:hypothetical protein
MALIALTYIGCIIYLALRTVLTRAMFRRRQRERKLDVFVSHQKSPRCSPGGATTSPKHKAAHLGVCRLPKNRFFYATNLLIAKFPQPTQIL